MTSVLNVYTEPEHVVLAAYLKMPALIKAPLSEADAIAALFPNGTGLAARLDSYGPRPLDVAIAHLALAQSQASLPQWASFRTRPDGSVAVRLARKEWPASRRAILRARHVLTINWADSCPGFSWPEAYNVTPLPLYEHWILTASVDSPDVWGVTDWALGAIPFMRTDQLADECKKLILEYWLGLAPTRGTDEESDMWAYVLNEGLLSADDAYAMRHKMFLAARDIEAEAGLKAQFRRMTSELRPNAVTFDGMRELNTKPQRTPEPLLANDSQEFMDLHNKGVEHLMREAQEKREQAKPKQ